MMKRSVLTCVVLLAASMLAADEARITVQADHVLGPVSRWLTGACIEDVNHEIYGGIYSQMVFGESFQEPAPAASPAISGMWRAVQEGSARGHYATTADRPFLGSQSQQIVFDSGEGRFGIENRGLNRWGMNFVAAKPYEGCLWARADKPIILFVALENHDGSRMYAEQRLAVAAGEWRRLDFTLTPSGADKTGRFAVVMKEPGAVTLGYAFLQPGEWGRFKGLPVRRDVAEGLINQGITVLRYGGCMVNNDEYRWKKMIGPRDRRPPYKGFWYPQSSNGWGILDFMDFCEAAGFEYIPAFNINESPRDMADFIEYAKGAADTPWGRRRADAGRAEPYRLRFLELGNEERVDEQYAAKFEALAEAIWAKDSEVILVVGDFCYDKAIPDPMNVSGAASRITNLEGQRRILQFAKRHNREVWFDVHVSTEQPQRRNPSLEGILSFRDALDRIADGAKHKVVVFEYNSGNHAVKRALANALATHAIMRDGRIPIAASANGLQPDGQNDNGWDQGLLFLNPSQVWLQPPGYVTQMLSRNYLPQAVKCQVTGTEEHLDAVASRDADGKTLVVSVVNAADRPLPARIRLQGFTPTGAVAKVTELSGPPDAVNAAARPDAIVPKEKTWPYGPRDDGGGTYTFAPHSFTVLRFE